MNDGSLVLATTKYNGHRVAIDRGLYAEGDERVPHLPKPTPLRTGG